MEVKMETIVKQEDSLKISMGMAGKHSWEFKLIGKVEDNLERAKTMKTELDTLTTESE